MRKRDRSEVNDRVIDFSELVEDVRLSRFNVSLPATFQLTGVQRPKMVVLPRMEITTIFGRESMWKETKAIKSTMRIQLSVSKSEKEKIGGRRSAEAT